MRKLLSFLATTTILSIPITSTFFTVSCGNFNSKVNKILNTNFKDVYDNIEKNSKNKEDILENFIRYLICEYNAISINIKDNFYSFKYDENKKADGWKETSLLYFLNQNEIKEAIKNGIDDKKTFKEKLDLSKLVNETSVKIEDPNIQLNMAYILSMHREDEDFNNKEFIFGKIKEFIIESSKSSKDDSEKIDLDLLNYSFIYKEPNEDSKNFITKIYIPKSEEIFKNKSTIQKLDDRSKKILEDYLKNYNKKIENNLKIKDAEIDTKVGINKKSGTNVNITLESSIKNNISYTIKVIEYLDKKNLIKFIKNFWLPQISFGLSLPIWRILIEDKVKTNSVKIKFNSQIVEILNSNLEIYLDYVKKKYNCFEKYINWENYIEG